MKKIMTFLMLLFVTPLMAQWQCGQNIINDIDGLSYPTTMIGEQCWLAKSLNTGSMAAGNVMATNNKNMNGGQVIEKFCYGNLNINCQTYGALYTWDEAMQYSTQEGAQGICPTDWHIPTYAEYNEMLTYLGGITVAGEKMKVTSLLWKIPGYNATNISGFTALPAGLKWDNEAFYNIGLDFNMWLSSMPPPDSRNPSQPAYYGGVSWGNKNANLGQFYKTEALSVRCIKD